MCKQLRLQHLATNQIDFNRLSIQTETADMRCTPLYRTFNNFFWFFYLIFPFSLWKTDNFNNDNSVIFFTSNRVSAVKSALYSMLTSAIPPLLARYEYFEALATEDILNVVCWFFFSLNSLSPVSFSIKSNCKIKCKIEGYT